MTRFRATVRGTDIELRGYIDGLATLRVTAKTLEGIGLVIASPAEDDFNPFAISEPDYPPTLESSRSLIAGLVEQTGNLPDLYEYLAELHFRQANVIRGERYLREKAEAELRDRELHHFETEQMVAGASAVADSLEKNWDSGDSDNDLAGAVRDAIGYLRGMEKAK
jgi:hypothetical protein